MSDKTSMQADDLRDLPDLPALESVETTETGGWPVPPGLIALALVILTLVVPILWVYIQLRDYVGAFGTILTALLVAFAVGVLVREAWSFYHFRTNAEGLAMRGLLRKRFIPWYEIQSMIATQTRMGEAVLRLTVRGAQIRVVPRGFSGDFSPGDRIVASVWQHLRRLGGTDRFPMPTCARGFWQDIPDDVPHDLDWGKPPSVGEKAAVIAPAAILAALIAALWVMAGGTAVGAMACALVTLVYALCARYAILPQALGKAHSVKVRDDYLEVILFKDTVRIPWSDVISSALSRTSLRVTSSSPRRQVWIPLGIGNEGPERVVPALIRRLRTAGTPQALALPCTMSSSPQKGDSA